MAVLAPFYFGPVTPLFSAQKSAGLMSRVFMSMLTWASAMPLHVSRVRKTSMMHMDILLANKLLHNNAVLNSITYDYYSGGPKVRLT